MMENEIPPIDESALQYKVKYLHQILDIPADALPRFYAELPGAIERLRQAVEVADEIADNAFDQFQAAHPILSLFISQKLYRRAVRNGLRSSGMVWFDDQSRAEKSVELSISVFGNSDPHYTARVNI